MKPAKADLEAWESASRKVSLTFKDKFGNLVDLNGYTAKMQIRTGADDESDTPLLELTTENGGLTVHGDLGKVTIFIQEVLLSYTGLYDMLLIAPSGFIHKPVKTSKFKVIPGVTHGS